jgi:secreted Zn-dependent insulinase-like peptidase
LQEFHLPEKNRFIATDLALRPAEEAAAEPGKAPALLLRDQQGELFHRQDTTFHQVPRCTDRP